MYICIYVYIHVQTLPIYLLEHPAHVSRWTPRTCSQHRSFFANTWKEAAPAARRSGFVGVVARRPLGSSRRSEEDVLATRKKEHAPGFRIVNISDKYYMYSPN